MHRYILLMILLPVLSLCGCFRWAAGLSRFDDHAVVENTPNPVEVPLVPREFVMDEVADELDNYFRIAREERVRLADDILTEGWIETHPEIGSGILEPWRKNSTRGYERWHASLQTVRRFAKARVIPTGNSYLIDVKVYKELEEVNQPTRSTALGPSVINDSRFEAEFSDQNDAVPNEGWIPMGRDISLEQQILQNIHNRITQACQQ